METDGLPSFKTLRRWVGQTESGEGFEFRPPRLQPKWLRARAFGYVSLSSSAVLPPASSVGHIYPNDSRLIANRDIVGYLPTDGESSAYACKRVNSSAVNIACLQRVCIPSLNACVCITVTRTNMLFPFSMSQRIGGKVRQTGQLVGRNRPSRSPHIKSSNLR